jgi:IS1 family transposase
VDICKKKEAQLTAIEKLMAVYGDQWVWIGFDPKNKIIVSFMVGRHTQAIADRLIADIKRRSDGHIPFFTSDQLKHYDDALLKAYGVKKVFSKTGKRGRPRKAILKTPKNLLYAQVVKHREKGRIVKITTRVVFGTKKAVNNKLRKSLVSNKINTSFVERNNLTMRHHNRRLVRRTIAFSKQRTMLVYQLYLFFAYYHFVKPHFGLPKWQNGKSEKFHYITPAMAAGFTDHKWSMAELFSFPIF